MNLKTITGISLVLIMLFSVSCGGQEEGTPGQAAVVKINIAHGASEAYHLHRAMEHFKQTVEALGGYEVAIHPSSQFGNDTEMIESVTIGDLQIALNPSSFFTQHSRRLTFIELPYVFSSRENAIAALGSDWAKEALLELEDDNLYGLGFFENGLRHLTNNVKEVSLPSDMAGLKLRVMQVPAHVDFWNAVGASASGSPFPELYTNLSTGVFDGQENPVAHIYAQKFYEVQDYLSLTGHVYTTYIAIANLDWYNSLSEQNHTEISSAIESAYAYQLELINTEEQAQLDEMTQSGLTVTTVTPEQKQQWMEVAAGVNAKYAQEYGQDLYDEFMATVNSSVQ